MRLKDIEVEEVSLVDRAANRLTFGLLKRDAGSEDFICVAGCCDNKDAPFCGGVMEETTVCTCKSKSAKNADLQEREELEGIIAIQRETLDLMAQVPEVFGSTTPSEPSRAELLRDMSQLLDKVEKDPDLTPQDRADVKREIMANYDNVRKL